MHDEAPNGMECFVTKEFRYMANQNNEVSNVGPTLDFTTGAFPFYLRKEKEMCLLRPNYCFLATFVCVFVSLFPPLCRIFQLQIHSKFERDPPYQRSPR